MRLFQNDIILARTTTLSDLLEANYSLYAPQQSTAWSAPAADVNGDRFTQAPVFAFNFTTPGTWNVIYGFYVTLDFLSARYLICAGRYNAPRAMNTPGDICVAFPKISARALMF